MNLEARPQLPAPSADLEALARLYDDPPRLGRAASEAREHHFGRTVRVLATRELACPEVAFVDRKGHATPCVAWPTTHLEHGDRIVVQVHSNDAERVAYLRYLATLRGSGFTGTLAPCAAQPASIHRLWIIGVARLMLPADVRVEARHELLGTRLAQLALGFGADTLAGPVLRDRTLPLAGVPSPNETSASGLEALVRHTGLEPRFETESA